MLGVGQAHLLHLNLIEHHFESGLMTHTKDVLQESVLSQVKQVQEYYEAIMPKFLDFMYSHNYGYITQFLTLIVKFMLDVFKLNHRQFGSVFIKICIQTEPNRKIFNTNRTVCSKNPNEPVCMNRSTNPKIGIYSCYTRQITLSQT